MFALVVAIGLLPAVWLVFSWSRKSTPARPNVALVDIEGDKSPWQYLIETGNLLARGYSEYSKKGLPFSVPNVVDPEIPMVILPLKYLDEVARAPQSNLSLPAYFAQLGQVKYIHGPPIAEEVQNVARTDLNRALNDLIGPLEAVCTSGFKQDMPRCKEWKPFAPYYLIIGVFVRMCSRMLAGPELHLKWVKLSLEYVPLLINATHKLRTAYQPSSRWLAPYFDSDVKELINCRKKAADIVGPVLRARLAKLQVSGDDTILQTNQDAISWLIKEHKSRGHTPSADDIAQNLLNMTVQSTHTMAMTGQWLLFDILDHPASLAEIRDEIARVNSENSTWTCRKLGELKYMDSFMTESARLHTSARTTVNRMVLKPHTFKDGFSLPAGCQVAFPAEQYSLDPDLHPNPEVFDPKRSLNKREPSDSSKNDFASTADTLFWGSGTHACPGRFLVQDSLKLIFVHLLQKYDLKYPTEGKIRPGPDVPNGVLKLPDSSMLVLCKEKTF